MDPVKIAIFVSAFAALLFVGRKFFSGETVYAQTPLPSPPQNPVSGLPPENGPAVIGAELPLPASLPPRELNAQGEYNRPEIANYYFKTLDLAQGPEDPECFCDEFFVEFVEPETATPMHKAVSWTNQYVVATPAGIQQMLKSGNHNSLVWTGMTIIMPRWDIPGLLRTVVEEVMRKD